MLGPKKYDHQTSTSFITIFRSVIMSVFNTRRSSLQQFILTTSTKSPENFVELSLMLLKPQIQMPF